MRIGSISELNNLTTHLSDLINNDTTPHGDLLIEVSERQSTNGHYDSKRFDLGKLCQQINDCLLFLSTEIVNLNNKTNDISSSYVKKSGDNMTGTLSIDVSTSSMKQALVLKTNNSNTDYILSSNSNNFYFGKEVVIDDGQLKCTKDIAGVALAAKWS